MKLKQYITNVCDIENKIQKKKSLPGSGTVTDF